MDVSNSTERLACYGLLMSRFATLDQLGVRAMLAPLGPCLIGGALYDIGEWPTLTREPGTVHGELFEVLDAAVFAVLDPYEGFDPRNPEGSSYLRLRMPLIEPRGEAWVYLNNAPLAGARRIDSGVWTGGTGS